LTIRCSRFKLFPQISQKVVAMTVKEFSGASVEDLQRERKHLETLFADRINFYLVFAAGVLAFLFGENHPKWLERMALIAVTMVSLSMIVALYRTFRLVMRVLDEILEKHQETPYAFYYKRASWLPNANYFLLALPISLLLFFAYALIRDFSLF
jgi:hypothetical protein